jgi:hypothetical protein
VDKKLNKDLENFFYGDPDTWDKILIEDTHRKKGEITSCCSFHALERFVEHYAPKATADLFDAKDLIKAQIKSIKKGLDTNVLNAITKWRCSDNEHNDYIDWIRALTNQEISKKKKNNLKKNVWIT